MGFWIELRGVGEVVKVKKLISRYGFKIHTQRRELQFIFEGLSLF